MSSLDVVRNLSPAYAGNATSVPFFFATTSNVKYSQYKPIFSEYGIDLRRGTAITSVLVEPQADYTLDPAGISIISHPLRQAARFVAKMGQLPYMIEDTMLFIGDLSKDLEHFVGLPGADTKNWWHNLGVNGVLRVLRNATNRRAAFTCQLGVYLGGSNYVFARATLLGSISYEARSSQIARDEVPFSNPFFFHEIFVPENEERTLAEMSGKEFSHHDYRRRCVKSLFSELLKTGVKLKEDKQLCLKMDIGE